MVVKSGGVEVLRLSTLLNATEAEKQLVSFKDGAFLGLRVATMASDGNLYRIERPVARLIIDGTGQDVLSGGNGDDQIYGGDHSDTIDGGNGDDQLDGGTGNDVITGGDGGDALVGGSGNDSLDGGSGDDVLSGGTGHDVLMGGDGNDTLDGGAHADTMTGGGGNDTFVFTGGGGQDVIVDFSAGDDIMEIAKNINGTTITTADDVAARATQVGSDTVVDLGNGDTITLHNVNADDVQADPSSYFSVH